ncbi:DUF551 domain-containing protein [Hymenobacter chitinivorans]|uniref:Uncharacterized protein DUF551 n=1 Tax=Hymenobacter chitinivorans DSM 11115 TaxID=1121954 RepID=A0A2M9BNV0_9BACT|nr:DUF551 domain-containing protein [Hymenobacter chitinivorans]PJJ59612.1 uncharacterized protein DUF551 [Hymenobacter chitinivorans DSM 11115]
MSAATIAPWIARAQQLPQPNQRVLVYVPTAWLEITVAVYKPSNASKSAHMFVTPDPHGVDRYVKGVTHWMPLPAPPLAT